MHYFYYEAPLLITSTIYSSSLFLSTLIYTIYIHTDYSRLTPYSNTKIGQFFKIQFFASIAFLYMHYFYYEAPLLINCTTYFSPLFLSIHIYIINPLSMYSYILYIYTYVRQINCPLFNSTHFFTLFFFLF
jgi:hypothetical protein